jgi:hypothetical protein
VTLTYVGELSLSAALPAPANVALAGSTGIGLALPDILQRLEALAAFSPSPVSFTASLALAQSIVESISKAIALGIVPPSMASQIAQVSALVSELLANVQTINGHLEVITDFQSLLTAAGVHVYAFDGEVDDLGAELAAALAGGVPGGTPTQHSNALVMVTTLAATWSAMAQIFKVTP